MLGNAHSFACFPNACDFLLRHGEIDSDMLTRIEIDGFKTFDNFGLDLRPLTAVVGPNASGKSNLFDALRFLSLLAQSDIRTAMQGVRGEPQELFRKTATREYDYITFAVEVLLPRKGVDAFGTSYETPAQRIRYKLKLGMTRSVEGGPTAVVVREESCVSIAKKDERAAFLKKSRSKVNYNARINPFIRLSDQKDAIEVRQDGRQKHGRPIKLSLREASRTALSTITTAEFPHLYALREALANMRFLEINPHAARAVNNRFEDTKLRPDASNLSAVLARLKDETATSDRPDGVLSDIASDLASLIPSISRLNVQNDELQRQYSFSLEFIGDLTFSSRVISDGTLRLLALLTVLNDPKRKGTLCFEEPENGVHEGRVPMLVEFLRNAAHFSADPEKPSFQILLNTHSPKVMEYLKDEEIVVSDSVTVIDAEHHTRAIRTRMRTGIVEHGDLIDPEVNLTRFELQRILQRSHDAA
jgi:predicted ATPase